MKVANPPLANEAKTYGVVLGSLAGFNADGAPLITLGGKPAIAAMTVVDIGEEHIGMRVVVQFEGGDQRFPLVMGVVRESGAQEPLPMPAAALHATVDDDEIVLVAHRRITFRCGSASITLDANGNVEIRGKHVISRASGQNRIKGSSVSLN